MEGWMTMNGWVDDAVLFEEDGAVQSYKATILNLQEECLAQGYFRWITTSNPITRVFTSNY
jgi:hypothetical protein